MIDLKHSVLMEYYRRRSQQRIYRDRAVKARRYPARKYTAAEMIALARGERKPGIIPEAAFEQSLEERQAQSGETFTAAGAWDLVEMDWREME